MADSTGADDRVPFYCDVEGCPKQSHPYTRREKLNEHIRSQHTGYRFTCPICSKRIIRIGDLNKHIRTAHEGHKPFVCEVGPANRSGCACGASFTKKSSLNRHQRPWIVDYPLECASNDILSLDISELRKAPKLWDAFIEVVESAIVKDDAYLFRGSSDGLLALCKDNVVPHESDDHGLQPNDGVSDQQNRSHDDIEASLYLRLVRLFRRSGPRTCSNLLEDLKVAFRNSDHEHFKLFVQTDGFLDQLHRFLSTPYLYPWPPIFILLLSKENHCTLVPVDGDDLARGLDMPLAKLLAKLEEKDSSFFKAHSEVMASWIGGILKQQTRMERETEQKYTSSLMVEVPFRFEEPIGAEQTRWQDSEIAKERPTAVVREALTAASYCKSVASGHTNSTCESVCSRRRGSGKAVTQPPSSRKAKKIKKNLQLEEDWLWTDRWMDFSSTEDSLAQLGNNNLPVARGRTPSVPRMPDFCGSEDSLVRYCAIMYNTEEADSVGTERASQDEMKAEVQVSQTRASETEYTPAQITDGTVSAPV